jgi:predicted Zn-dependent peptidase
MKGTTAASGETQSTTRFVNHTKQLASRIRDLRLPPGHPLQEGQGDAPTRPTPEELKKFHLSQIAPSILTVVVSGGVTAAAAREAVTGSLGSWSTGAVVKPPPPLPATKPLWIMEQEAPRSGAQVLFSMPGLSRPDLPPVAGELLLADFLQQLGAQMGDNGVQLDHGSPPDTDHLDFLVRTAVGGTADKISLVRAQLEAYNRRDRQVTLGLVARNLREQEWGRFIEQIGTTQGLANLMTGLVLADRPLDDLARTARLLQAESQDSPLVIDGALPADQLHTTILGKLAKERPGLARQKLGLPEARAFPRARSR